MGFALVIIATLYFPGNLWALVLGIVGLTVYLLLKEILADPRTEGNPFLWNGVTDMAFHYVGVGVTLFALFLTHKFP